MLFLAVLLTLSVLQFYTLGPLTAPVAWSLLFLPSVLLRPSGLRLDRFAVLIVLILVATLFALSYSRAVAEGVRDLIAGLSILTPYLAVRQAGPGAWRVVGRALAWSSPAFLLQCGLTILFQVDPALETAYLRWPDAVLFSDVYVRDIFTTAFNNVLQEKSGGFFLNGNIASMFMAGTAMLSFAAWRRQGGGILLLSALGGLAGALFTLSKTAIVLALALPLGVAAVRGLKGKTMGPIAWLIAIPTTVAGVFGVAALFPQLANAGLLTLGARGEFLRLAASAFPEQWLLGLGFGGWHDLWLARAAQFTQHSEPRPPHNLVVMAWANGGLLLALPVLAFLLTATVAVLRLLLRVDTSEAVVVGALAVGLLWIFVHGMADNTSWFGDQHSRAVMAVSVALVAGMRAEVRGGARASTLEAEQVPGAPTRAAERLSVARVRLR
ncbi:MULTISPECIES: O-antigen ligase family protein [unclassified Rathayibacter]|uniref:O-antigen ligase family protein n=1 Tax=unclassified Rathayibacter TaxID=2609250 RepID=UPI00188CFA21|nr:MULTISPECIES: hypothetical protein [unclassified Rathayibacter]MBF4461892.1 hypothetical protein [Rathayibacter sp. VKM Ac-2879]MBF4504065.1 hypothetical protein [Rathayibacter sp. VKM Ac-2878]